ncbi:uncharacterized protein [Haliotis cracherodii]|uniref:uncharacterized protein n=1 Tax=Haliotis cracherodii TaxID=6455 RepID=UPI0039EA635A
MGEGVIQSLGHVHTQGRPLASVETFSATLLRDKAHSGARYPREGGHTSGRDRSTARQTCYRAGSNGTGKRGLLLHLFPRHKKKDGGFRPFLNLRKLNKLIEVPSFRMETLRSVISAVESGEWLTSIDLKDAYLHEPIHSEFKKYLWFSFDARCYQFRILPFRISPAPRVFTKLMLIPAQVARSKGRFCHPYLNDWLLRALSHHMSQIATQEVLDILVSLGWIVNLKKSDLNPAQTLVFLGANLNTESGLVSLSQDRIVRVKSVTSLFLLSTRHTARTWLQLLGNMSATVDVVWRARLRMRPIQQALRRLWANSEDLEKVLETTAWLIPHLQWWTEDGNLSRGLPLDTAVPSLTVQTDASLSGWGGVLNDHTAS